MNKSAPQTTEATSASRSTSPAAKTSSSRAVARTAPVAKKTAAKGPATKPATRKSATKVGGRASASAATATTTRVAPGAIPVREGESPWTSAELAEVRQELAEESARLKAEIAETELDLAGLLRDSGDGAGDDQADAGSKTFAREHEMSLADNYRDMLLQNERALARLAGGTYGICESCGNPIGKARLQAFPRATLCMSCKVRQERR
ncbi:MAG TPA: TraR/DksA C4-type zinc finger protein [Actinomycetes bacterium]|nr:TraR/DksA C4-type zinc finger protein [Actinomycetes bacterium]